jgi:hypothetical protein
MTYKSVLFNLDIDAQAAPVIKLATGLAKRFNARLIGLAAAAISPPFVAADGVAFDADIMLHQRENIEGDLKNFARNSRGLPVPLWSWNGAEH